MKLASLLLPLLLACVRAHGPRTVALVRERGRPRDRPHRTNIMGGPHLPSKGGCMEGGLALKAQCPWSAQCLQGFLEEAARPACSS